MVLVNPATSFADSPWPALGPLLPQVPKVSAAQKPSDVVNPTPRVSKSVANAFSASYEVGYNVCWFVFAVAWILRECCCMQELYSAVPVALAPVLGNPLLLAAFGVDRTAPLQEQVLLSHPFLCWALEAVILPCLPGNLTLSCAGLWKL